MVFKGRVAPVSMLILIIIILFAYFFLMPFHGNVGETIICRNEAYRVEECKTNQGSFLIAYKTGANEAVENRESLAER